MIALIVEVTTPDDHFTASPHRGVSVPASGRVGGAGSRPTVVARIVSAAGIQSVSTPDDHFTATPHRCMRESARWGVAGASGCPVVDARSISSASV
jgi:hypothetical protein